MQKRETARELLERAQNGEREARSEMIRQNMGLIWSIVQKFRNRGMEMEDLFQVGAVGLIKAVDRFDLRQEVCFSTYAVPLIAGEIRRYLRDNGMIKVSRSLKENGWKIQKAREKIEHAKGREAHLSEIEEETRLTQEEILNALEANAQVESLARPVSQKEGKEICLSDQIAAPDRQEEILDRLFLERLLEQLDDREAELIRYRYFEEKTQAQTAQKMGLTQVQVSRAEKKILQILRRMI